MRNRALFWLSLVLRAVTGRGAIVEPEPCPMEWTDHELVVAGTCLPPAR